MSSICILILLKSEFRLTRVIDRRSSRRNNIHITHAYYKILSGHMFFQNLRTSFFTKTSRIEFHYNCNGIDIQDK